MPTDSFNDPGVPVEFQRILDQVNYPDLPTIYGPVSQYAFLLSYFLKAGSLVPLQLLFIGFDILLIRLLLSAAPAGYVLLYAKMLALLLAPFVLARTGLRAWLVFGAVLALLYLPFLLQGSTDTASLAVFARAWEFNAALYGMLTQWLPDTDAKLLLAAGLLALGSAYWLHYRWETPGEIPRGDWIYGLFLFAAPVINPWYVLWLLPFAVVYPSFWAWTASWALFLSYITGLNLGNYNLEPFAHPVWVRPLEFGLILIAPVVDIWRRRSRRS